MTFQVILDEIKAIAVKLETAIGILSPVVEALDPAAAPVVAAVEAVAEGVATAVGEPAATETTPPATQA